ncbi:8732_t:CDS:2 [Acaulospora morrowiae]|uniref:8732_t:CDS:1 n=1 Tax=Acaulospora morrowiae TaxID=94023 RepID=A0A9N9AA86_9GLOM|nr:8732_t:CDS:2 [Acaulospora morrowiae]
MTSRPSSQSGYTVILIDNAMLPPPPPPSNWPKCYPIVYHNIEADFTNEDFKKKLRRSYFLFKFYFVTLLANSIADIAISITYLSGAQIVSQIIASALYLFLMPIGDFFLRHMSLYYGYKMNSEMMFRYYFLGEAIVIIFGLFIGIGFVNDGSSGTLGAVKLFERGYYVAGVFTGIFLVLDVVQTILHIILTAQVCPFVFRGGVNDSC